MLLRPSDYTFLVAAVAVGLAPLWTSQPSLAAGDASFSLYWITIPIALCLAAAAFFADRSEKPASSGDRLQATGDYGAYDLIMDPDSTDSDSLGSTAEQSGMWVHFENQFRKVLDVGGRLKANWVRTDEADSETWQLESGFDPAIAESFKTLATDAGRALVEIPELSPQLSVATGRESDPMIRWLSLIRERDINTHEKSPGVVVGANDLVVGHTHAGGIERLVEASVKLCTQLAREQAERNKDPTAGSPKLIDDEKRLLLP